VVDAYGFFAVGETLWTPSYRKHAVSLILLIALCTILIFTIGVVLYSIIPSNEGRKQSSLPVSDFIISTNLTAADSSSVQAVKEKIGALSSLLKLPNQNLAFEIPPNRR